MSDRYPEVIKDLINALAKSRVAFYGFMVAAIVCPFLLISLALDWLGIVSSPYFGFLIYLIMGPIFVAGVITVFVGLFLFQDKEAIGLFTLEYIKEQLSMPGRFARIRKQLYFSTFLVIFTLAGIGIFSYAGFSYTQSIGFCALFCHQVMEPEYISHQNSPHSSVRCVDCHISSGAGLFTKAKLTGVKMIFATAFGKYDKPIATPITSLRPDQAACLQCHRPEMFHGDRLYIKDSYLPDEGNTPVQTVLLMRTGSSGHRGRQARGIHWHVSPNHKTHYRMETKRPGTISEVKLIDQDGTVLLFTRRDGKNTPQVGAASEYRLMECIDCHNRPTHVFLSPEEALDRKISAGLIPASLPYIKRLGLELLQQDYADRHEALRRIALAVREWYGEKYPGVVASRPADLEKAINGMYQAWSENVFPEMKITWNTYANNLGHRDDQGCFRCHNDQFISPDGRVITKDCNLCHVVLADREADPEVLRMLNAKR